MYVIGLNSKEHVALLCLSYRGFAARGICDPVKSIKATLTKRRRFSGEIVSALTDAAMAGIDVVVVVAHVQLAKNNNKSL